MTKLIDLVVAFVLVLLFVGQVYLLVSLYHRLRRKGYLPTFALVILAVTCIGGGLLSYMILLQGADSTSIRQTNLRISVIILICGGLAGLVTFVLPQRIGRRSGPRRIRAPFKLLALICAGTAPLVIFYPEIFPFDLESASLRNKIKLPSLIIGVAIYLYWLGCRATHASTIEEIVEKDTRPPVVYLRPFHQDYDYFAFRDVDWATRFLSNLTVGRRQKYEIENLEEFLGEQISSDLGPFVALGSPEDYLPPEGATRTYADDRGWQEYFLDLAKRAECFIMQVSRSENLTWELSTLREMGLQEKLFILTSQEKPPMSWLMLKYVHLTVTLRRLIRGIPPPPEWSTFSQQLSGCGYHLDLPYPGHGAVLTFNDQATAVLLKQSAATPSEYVDAIIDSL